MNGFFSFSLFAVQCRQTKQRVLQAEKAFELEKKYEAKDAHLMKLLFVGIDEHQHKRLVVFFLNGNTIWKPLLRWEEKRLMESRTKDYLSDKYSIERKGNDMEFQWLGNASAEICCDQTHILVDPYFQKGNEKQNHLLKEALFRADLILITHPHFDHFNDIKWIADHSSIPIYVGPSGPKIARRQGVKGNPFLLLKDGMEIPVGRDASIFVYASRHIEFDDPLKKETLKRMLKPENIRKGVAVGFRAMMFSMQEDDIFAFEIREQTKSLFLIGSGALKPDVKYPVHPDLFLLAYQGRSDLDIWSIPILRQIRPKKTLLFHFDDAFPPVSQRVDTTGLTRRIRNVSEAPFGVWLTV